MKKNNKPTSRRIYIIIGVAIAIVIGAISFYFFTPMSNAGEKKSIYVDADDNIDSVYAKIAPNAHAYSMSAYKLLTDATGYGDNIKAGHYLLTPEIGTFTFFRKMRNGMQDPVRITINTVRTMDRLAAELSKKLLASEDEILSALTDPQLCDSLGTDTANVYCLFIPDTYEFYWDIKPAKLMEKMKKASDQFWTKERLQKANALGLTRQQVVTLASIVDEETANDAEKPMIAGLYLNRYNAGMKLQADPTVKFALKQFGLKRILNKHLTAPSPYNTYMNIGLPPGPIRIPSVAGINAVLNRVNHNYMYMCAKEDFSGTHNFAATYSEHLANAAKYTAALNARGIK